jgi:hypothetical protein
MTVYHRNNDETMLAAGDVDMPQNMAACMGKFARAFEASGIVPW